MIVASNPSRNHERQREIILRVAMSNFVLAILQLGIGVAGYSKLMIMGGIVAFANGMMLLIMWPGYEMENRERDERHPYGYGKVLFAIAFIVGVLFLVISVYMYSYSQTNMDWEEIHRSNSAVVMVSVIAFAANLAMFHFLKKEGVPQPNGILAWNALNNLMTAIVSILILICIILSSLGLFYMEKVGAMVISAILFCLSLRMLFNSSGGIMDRAPSRKIMELIRASAEQVRGVAKILEIKARHIGTYIHVDVALIIEQDVTMREANEVAHRVETSVAHAIPFFSKEINALIV